MTNKQIVRTLENVGSSKGVVCTHDDEHVLGTRFKYVDDYLAVLTLAELIKKDKAHIVFTVGREDKEMEYLCKLLEK